ncbi:uncharacterized protein LOC121834877, partial [Ixodes scapularis]|uniref:uncharacterized protein LOC121834877 n=1 Tax=Ixodes scapularis TaxID=6945 RepID=UPI001C39593E
MRVSRDIAATALKTTLDNETHLGGVVRLTLPPKKRTKAKEGNVVILGDLQVPDSHLKILKKGPKFCLEPMLRRVDKLVMSRSISRATPEEDRPRCVFAAKTHKPGVPFRTIVSERNSWLHAISGFLQRHLDSLHIVDPMCVPNSKAVVDFLNVSNPHGCSAFSIDVEELYYSMPHDDLMVSVKECITEHNDESAFRTRCGITIEDFLGLLSVYLKSTLIGWQDKVYIQKSGVCIGSRVAPVLSNIFLGKIDRDLEPCLEKNTKKVFRYVDNYLVFVERANFQQKLDDVLKIFTEKGLGLHFTYEAPKQNLIQFLDLRIEVGDDHVCWCDSPRTAKALLNFQSAHSKLVKQGIAFACLRTALTSTCIHNLNSSFMSQIQRLKDSGYPNSVISSACEKIVKHLKTEPAIEQRDLEQKEKKKTSVIPYIHRLSHGLKKVASRYNVNVVFSARHKLSSVCSAVNKRARNNDPKSHSGCSIKHGMQFVACIEGVVYKIPFSCGRAYIRQTGRCLNIRLREHHSS